MLLMLQLQENNSFVRASNQILAYLRIQMEHILGKMVVEQQLVLQELLLLMLLELILLTLLHVAVLLQGQIQL